MKFGEPVLIGTGLDEKVRRGLLEKMIGLRKQKQDTGANPCEDSSKQKTDDKRISVGMDDKNKTSNMIKDTNVLKAREGKEGPGQRCRVSNCGGNTPE